MLLALALGGSPAAAIPIFESDLGQADFDAQWVANPHVAVQHEGGLTHIGFTGIYSSIADRHPFDHSVAGLEQLLFSVTFAQLEGLSQLRVNYFEGETNLFDYDVLLGQIRAPGTYRVLGELLTPHERATHFRHEIVIEDGSAAVDAFSISTPPHTLTPEPGTLALLASGIAALGARRRRRRA